LGATSSIVEILRAAVHAPMAEGVNITTIVQLAFGGNRTAASVVLNKSLALTPKTAMLVMLKAELPELVRVTV